LKKKENKKAAGFFPYVFFPLERNVGDAFCFLAVELFKQTKLNLVCLAIASDYK
jgi:hypothetical protein